MKKKIIIWTLVTILLISSVFATTKPITGKVVGQIGDVNLFVEVKILDQTEICTPNPVIQTGPDGSFATNLDNLVVKDVPEVKCGNRWKAGDKIWYEVDNHKSEVEIIASGTGLQILSDLIITQPTTTPSTGGSGGGGSSSSSTTEPIVIEPLPQTLIPKVDVSLSTIAGSTLLRNILKLNLLNNIPGDLQIKIILSELNNDKTIKTITDQILLQNQIRKEYSFVLVDLEPGYYKTQAFVYYQGRLIAASNIEKFSNAIQPLELIEIPKLIEEKQGEFMPVQVILLIIFVCLLFYMILKQIKK